MYATKQDIIDQEGEQVLYDYFDRAGDGIPDDAAIDRALNRASGVVDSCLGKKFVIPIDPVHALLIGYVVDLALWFGGNASEAWRTRYNDAIKWLKSVLNGDIDIGLVEIDQPEAAPDSKDVIVAEASSQIFTEEKLDRI